MVTMGGGLPLRGPTWDSIRAEPAVR